MQKLPLVKPILITLLLAPLSWAVVTLGGPAKDGAEVTCDLPLPERIKNIGSRRDGAGMCVMSSIEMAARWQGLEQMRGLRDWCAQYPGGAYPSKVDKQIPQFCKEKGTPVPPFVQEENVGWQRVAEVLKTGRIACVTYGGQDGVRYRGPIAHMVCSVLCDQKTTVILDNNGIGENELLWMDSAQDFDRRFKMNGGGWLFYWLAPPPSPVPRN